MKQQQKNNNVQKKQVQKNDVQKNDVIKFGQLEKLAIVFNILQKMQFQAIVSFYILQNIKELQKGVDTLEEFRKHLLKDFENKNLEELKNDPDFEKKQLIFNDFLNTEFELKIKKIKISDFGSNQITPEFLDVLSPFLAE